VRPMRTLAILLVGALAAAAAEVPELSAEMVTSRGDQVMQTMKLFLSGEKTRTETPMMGGMIIIMRRDKKLTWTLYTQKKVYMEAPLDPKMATTDPANPPGLIKKEELGKEEIQGYTCTKYRITIKHAMAPEPMTTLMWIADKLGFPLRTEMMGMVTEYRNLKVGAQPAELFELPAGYTKTDNPFAVPVPTPKAKEEEPAPKEEEPKPKVEEPKPKVEEPAPKVEEPAPKVEEPKPAVKEEPPAPGPDAGAILQAWPPTYPGTTPRSIALGSATIVTFDTTHSPVRVASYYLAVLRRIGAAPKRRDLTQDDKILAIAIEAALPQQKGEVTLQVREDDGRTRVTLTTKAAGGEGPKDR